MSGILVLTDHLNGTLSASSLEMLGLAAQLRAAGHQPVRVVVIGKHMRGACEELEREGVDEIILVEQDAPEFDAPLYEAIAVDLVGTYRPDLVQIGHGANGMAYGPALAVALGTGFAADVFDVRSISGSIRAKRSGYGNKVDVTLEFPDKSVTTLTIRGGAYQAPARKKAAPERVVLPNRQFDLPGRWTHEGFIEPLREGVDVSKSEFILALGRGIQDEKSIPRFERLAQRLGATLACSRPVADAGWLPKSRQVGLTGKPATSCKLYLAMGISGAVQHLWGMKHVETIIAINIDPHAPIFGAATYGITSDLFAVADALERKLG